jgi:DNA polymerase
MGAEQLSLADAGPKPKSLTALRREASRCKACALWKSGTQTVFGEGKASAELMMVGEQPGDREDMEGRPFVGPAGKLLDRALEQAGIDRDQVYLTNVVKHFKWRPRPWLEAELEVVKPRVLVCLGATAAQALLGRAFRVSRQRGEFVPSELAPLVTATVHPSSILRAPDEEARALALEELVRDLEQVRRAL